VWGGGFKQGSDWRWFMSPVLCPHPLGDQHILSATMQLHRVEFG